MEKIMPLSEALDKLKIAIGDLSSLEVQTYVGNIELAIDDLAGSTSFEDTLSNAKKSGNLKLSLVTKINFDGDAIALVPDIAPADYIQKAHDSALKAGNDVRQGLIELFSDVIEFIVPNK